MAKKELHSIGEVATAIEYAKEEDYCELYDHYSTDMIAECIHGLICQLDRIDNALSYRLSGYVVKVRNVQGGFVSVSDLESDKGTRVCETMWYPYDRNGEFNEQVKELTEMISECYYALNED